MRARMATRNLGAVAGTPAAANHPAGMTLTTDAAPKPRLALAIATGLGLGYLPKAPGTWGSLLGVLLGWWALRSSRSAAEVAANSAHNFLLFECVLVLAVSAAGLWAAGRAARYLGKSDPQIVVVDEVAGQLIAYLGLATPRTFALNWKYLLAGLILFRVFDIWKPFPARQAEALHGGLGIMADDWIAGVYAALVLGIARYLGA
jgi:phosphatidylglycerophosphatase A